MIRWCAAADLPDVLQDPELDGPAHPIRRHQGSRDPGPAPPARRASTAYTAPADEPDRSRPDRRAHPTTPQASAPRPARHPGHHPALAPTTGRPPLDNHTDPTRSASHLRRLARPGRPPGQREPHLGIPPAGRHSGSLGPALGVHPARRGDRGGHQAARGRRSPLGRCPPHTGGAEAAAAAQSAAAGDHPARRSRPGRPSDTTPRKARRGQAPAPRGHRR
jgi:hypothetical protein